MEEYKIQDILGHDDIAPYRKNDPGPIFPMESFRAKLLGREDDTADTYEITATNVNIRKGPGVDFDSYGQIKKGQKVEFMKSNMGWFYVYILEKPKDGNEVLYGWINGDFLKKI